MQDMGLFFLYRNVFVMHWTYKQFYWHYYYWNRCPGERSKCTIFQCTRHEKLLNDFLKFMVT